MYNKDQKFVLSENQISTSIDGESVILNHEKGEYFSLNEVGTAIWNLLENGVQDFNTILNMVSEQFGVDVSDIESDISELLNDLIKEELVEKV